MIGQFNLQRTIESMKLPNFTIFVGEKGSGKKTFIRENFKSGREVWLNSVKVDDIRDMITLSYKLHDTIFIIPDVDTMSLSAKNAMLKVVEECPNGNKYIMTLMGINNTLDTIKSRATVFNMDSYTPHEIHLYANEHYKHTISDAEWGIIKDTCDTPGDVNTLGNNPLDFYEYVELVFNNIAEVSGANAFKIADKIALKDEEDKYNLKLFWRAFLKKCVSEGSKNKNIDYLKAVEITANTLNDLRITGINKQMLFDIWLLKIREAWM